MYKSLSSGLIAFCLLSSFNSQAATSQRVTKSSSLEIKTLLEQNAAARVMASSDPYFIELESTHTANSKQVVSSAQNSTKKMQQYLAGVPIWGQQIRVQNNNQHISGFFAKDINLRVLKKTANTEFDESIAINTLLKAAKLDSGSNQQLISNERYIFIENNQSYYVRLIELKVFKMALNSDRSL